MAPLNIALPTVAAFSHRALSQRDLKLQVARRYGTGGDEWDVSSDTDDDAMSLPSLNHNGWESDDDDMSVDSNETFNRFSERIVFGEGRDVASNSNTDRPPNYGEDDYFSGEDDDSTDGQRKERSPNAFGYEIGDFMDCSYYHKFLSPRVRQRTYIQSRDRNSSFRSHFRATLSFIDTLTHMFIDRGWWGETKRVRGDEHFVRTQLLIMACLEHLGNRKPFRQFDTHTNMSYTLHNNFFKDCFLVHFVECKDEFIKYPETMDELKSEGIERQNTHKEGMGGGDSVDIEAHDGDWRDWR